ncbi:MAG: hypothetical protein AAF408_13890, partial [Pseudomonadota bacterium]
MAQISLKFPDGNARSYDAGVTPAQVAADISIVLSSWKSATSIQQNPPTGSHWKSADNALHMVVLL